MSRAIVVAKLALILVAGTGVAHAQDAASVEIYKRLDATYPPPAKDRLLPILHDTTVRYSSTWKTCTPTSLTIRSIVTASADQIAIQQIAHAGAHNAWAVSATAGGCPEHAPLHFLVIETKDGSLEAALFAVGETLVWPSLVHDSVVKVMIAVDPVLKRQACEARPRRIDAKILSRDKDLADPAFGVIFKGGWRELWTFERCGSVATIPVDFQADGNGGAYFQASMSEATLLPQR